jgi:hypothetical protein
MMDTQLKRVSQPFFSSASIAAVFITACSSAHAATLSSNLQIGSSVELSTTIGQSTFSDGNVTQTGNIRTTAGGTYTELGYSTAPGTADGVNDNSTTLPTTNPLSANLTDTGDGVGYATNLDALPFTGFEFNEGYDFIVEFGLDLENTSLTDTFTITLQADYSNVVQASGTDSFADAKLDLELNLLDVLSSEVLSDTLLGDEKNGVSLGTFGAEVSDMGVFFFDVILTPGEAATIAGTHQWEGGVFDDGFSNVDIDFDLTIADVSCSGECLPAVPIPAAAYLFASALSGLALLRRRRYVDASIRQ